MPARLGPQKITMRIRWPLPSLPADTALPDGAVKTTFVRSVTIGAVLISLLVGAMVAATAIKSYQQRVNQAIVTVENLSLVLEESLFGSVSLIDGALLSVSDEAARQAAMGGIDRAMLNAFIERQNARLPRTDGLRATNAEGQTHYGVGVTPGVANAVGRDYYVRLHDDATAGLVLSKPLIGRISGKWAVIFARRHNRPDGGFNGVVFLPINLETFAKDFSSIDVGRNGVISLFGENGNVIVRQPDPNGHGSAVDRRIDSPKIREMIRSGERTGAYRSRSSLDDVERLVSARKIENFPLYVAVGLDPNDYLSDWYRDAAIWIGSWMLFSVLLASLSWLTIRGWKQGLTTARTQELNRDLEAKVADRTRDLEASNRKLEALIGSDGLTGIANRRRLDAAIADEWKRSTRAGQSLGLVICDIDFFKNYNDHYGHVQGDECLRAVAQLLDSHARRPGDLVARYGGEEFVVLLPHIDAAAALGIAQSICEAVARLAIPHASSPFHVVTISAGVAALTPDPTHPAEVLVKTADEALYAAKKHGRNTAMLAEGTTVL